MPSALKLEQLAGHNKIALIPITANITSMIIMITSAILEWINQDKVNLMFSHINSTPRESLGGKTPYEIFWNYPKTFYFFT